MKIHYSTRCGLILLPGESGHEPTVIGVDPESSGSTGDDVSLLSLVSDWQEMEVETLEIARGKVRAKYWRYWSTRLAGELIIGLPTELERDTILYLDKLFASRARPEEVVGDLLRAPLAKPENARLLASFASDLECVEVANVLRVTAELQPRIAAFSHAWRNLSAEHFVVLGLPREELWQLLVDRGRHRSCLLATDIDEFTDHFVQNTIHEIHGRLAPSARQSLRSMTRVLAERFYDELAKSGKIEPELPGEVRAAVTGLRIATRPFVDRTGELWSYYQKQYEYSYQGTLTDRAFWFPQRFLPPTAITSAEPPRQFVPTKSLELLLSAA